MFGALASLQCNLSMARREIVDHIDYRRLFCAVNETILCVPALRIMASEKQLYYTRENSFAVVVCYEAAREKLYCSLPQ
jgi:hypothetical protein